MLDKSVASQAVSHYKNNPSALAAILVPDVGSGESFVITRSILSRPEVLKVIATSHSEDIAGVLAAESSIARAVDSPTDGWARLFADDPVELSRAPKLSDRDALARRTSEALAKSPDTVRAVAGEPSTLQTILTNEAAAISRMLAAESLAIQTLIDAEPDAFLPVRDPR